MKLVGDSKHFLLTIVLNIVGIIVKQRLKSIMAKSFKIIQGQYISALVKYKLNLEYINYKIKKLLFNKK